MSILTTSFAHALAAAREAAGAQDYPQGALYMVATPIGNLADLSLRALHVLALADTLACEDTRHTQTLLRAVDIERPGASLLAVHQHNEAEAAEAVLRRLAAGERVAFVSDAGTPAVSDPGARLASAVRSRGLRVIPLPGASSVTALLSAAGQVGEGGFEFHGFLPARAGEREAALRALAGPLSPAASRPIVLLEAPHRIRALAESLRSALAHQPGRRLTVGRELTKQFEEIAEMAVADFPAWLAEAASRERGEFALVLHAPPQDTEESAAQATEGMRVLGLLLAELPLKTAVKLAAEISGEPRNALYEAALRLKQAPGN